MDVLHGLCLTHHIDLLYAEGTVFGLHIPFDDLRAQMIIALHADDPRDHAVIMELAEDLRQLAAFVTARLVLDQLEEMTGDAAVKAVFDLGDRQPAFFVGGKLLEHLIVGGMLHRG